MKLFDVYRLEFFAEGTLDVDDVVALGEAVQ